MSVADCTADADLTVTCNGVTVGKTTADLPYVLIAHSGLFANPVRVEAEQGRAWADGSWSGLEWNDARTVQLTVLVRDAQTRRGMHRWLAVHRPLAAAFKASPVDVPLEFTIDNPGSVGGVDSYVVFGRPRGTDPITETAINGYALTRAYFRVTDPRIYSVDPATLDGLHIATTGLPSTSGGLTIPATVPIVIGATVTGNSILLTNAGTADAPLLLTIAGPVSQPRVTLITSTVTYILRYNGDLAAGETLVLDTEQHTALLNGSVSRRGLVTAEPSGQWPLLPPGTSELLFDAATFDAAALLTVQWRDAWTA